MINKLKFLIGAVVLAVIAGMLYSAGFLDFLNPFSFRDYTSPTFGYAIRYPRNWTLDGSREKAPLDILHDVNKKAVVFIQVFESDDYTTAEGRQTALAAMKKDFETRREYKLNYFNIEIVDGQTQFTANGLYRDSNSLWTFNQKGAFLGDRKAYSITSRILTGHVDDMGETTAKIVASFRM